MTEQEAIDLLDALNGKDPEADHVHADEVLLRFLRAQGFTVLAERFEAARDRVVFWYS